MEDLRSRMSELPLQRVTGPTENACNPMQSISNIVTWKQLCFPLQPFELGYRCSFLSISF